MPQKMDTETYPNVKRRLGKYVVMNEAELEVLEDLATFTDRSASAVVRVAVRKYAEELGLIKGEPA